MKSKSSLIFLFFILSCSSQQELNEREILSQKVSAFSFLSSYHHQLHIMIGEEDGDKVQAFRELKNAPIIKKNNELLPVYNAILRIKDVNSDKVNVKRLDDLVDYYQSGLSIQIEAILRGVGYKENLDMETVMELYDELLKVSN